MTKRSTTGKPRKDRDIDARKRYRSKSERERYYQQLLMAGAGVGAAIIVLVLAVALIYDLFVVPGQEISTVNGTEIKTNDFQERVRAQRWFLANQAREIYEDSGVVNDQIVAQLQDEEGIGVQVLDDMELEILLRDVADDYGVSVDQAAIQAQVDDYLSSFTNRSLTPTPTQTPTAESTPTREPLITATASNTPAPSNTPTETLLPTVEGCEDEEDCPTITPLPTATATSTPTATPETTDTPTPTNTPLPQEDVRGTVERFEDQYFDDAEETDDVEREAVEDIFYLVALRDGMRDAVTDQMIADGEMRDTRMRTVTRHILITVPGQEERQNTGIFDETLCESEEWAPYLQQAEDVINRLNNGESFALLAQMISDDPGSGANGGVLPEVADAYNSGFVEQFQQTMIDLDAGVLSDPVCTIFGYHIIQNLEKEITEIPEFELRGMRDETYQNWETDLLLAADIQRRDDWRERIPDNPTVDDLLGDILDE